MHISQLTNRRVETVDEVLRVGDMVWVKILPEDKPGKISASMKAVDQETGSAAAPSERGGPHGRHNEKEEDVSHMTWGLQPLDRSGEDALAESGPSVPKAQPNYETTGKLAEASNMVKTNIDLQTQKTTLESSIGDRETEISRLKKEKEDASAAAAEECAALMARIEAASQNP